MTSIVYVRTSNYLVGLNEKEQKYIVIESNGSLVKTLPGAGRLEGWKPMELFPDDDISIERGDSGLLAWSDKYELLTIPHIPGDPWKWVYRRYEGGIDFDQKPLPKVFLRPKELTGWQYILYLDAKKATAQSRLSFFVGIYGIPTLNIENSISLTIGGDHWVAIELPDMFSGYLVARLVQKDLAYAELLNDEKLILKCDPEEERWEIVEGVIPSDFYYSYNII